MSELKSDSTLPTEIEVVNTSRRKLTSAALAGPVILGTLVSKQALGGVPYHCTISGQISGTGSVRPQEAVVCNSLGRSPGFWKNHWSCWGIDGTVNGIMVPGPFRPFSAIFGGTNSCRMGDILENCGNCQDDVARAAIASYLNALHFQNSYPLTTDQVTWLYTNASSGPVGNYAASKTTSNRFTATAMIGLLDPAARAVQVTRKVFHATPQPRVALRLPLTLPPLLVLAGKAKAKAQNLN